MPRPTLLPSSTLSLLEGNRNKETQREIQLTVQKFLAHVEQAGLPADSKQAAAA